MSTSIRALGLANAVYRMNAVRAYASGAETAETCEMLTDVFYPVGESGDCVFRRVYVPFEYDVALSLTITPIVDGVEYPEWARTVTRTGAGRETVYLALAVRGSRIQLRITSTAPAGRWVIDNNIFVFFRPGVVARDAGAAST